MRQEWEKTVPGLYDTAQKLAHEGNEEFQKKQYAQAIEKYQASMEKFSTAKDGAAGLEDGELESSITKTRATCETNIGNCKIALDKDKIEGLSQEANGFIEASLKLKEKGSFLEARSKLREADTRLNEAFDICRTRNFNEASQEVQQIMARLRSEMTTVDTAITTGVAPTNYNDKPIISGGDSFSPRLASPRQGPSVSRESWQESLGETVDTGNKALGKEVGLPYTVFKIGKKIGSGSFGDVHFATFNQGRQAAIKIPRGLSLGMDIGPSVIKEFSREGELWYSLSKKNIPGIVSVYGYGVSPYPWIAMEYMGGGNLRNVLGKLDLPSTLGYVSKILRALSHAHHYGVFHRDLKPENILLTREGEPKISDWGLGRFLLKASTTTKGFAGTPWYSAPEQFDKQQFGEPDWRTDIFQIGAVIYEMLTLQRPFPGEELTELMYSIIHKEPRPPSQINPAISRPLEQMILKALSKRKEDRYQGIDVMLEDFKQAAWGG